MMLSQTSASSITLQDVRLTRHENQFNRAIITASQPISINLTSVTVSLYGSTLIDAPSHSSLQISTQSRFFSFTGINNIISNNNDAQSAFAQSYFTIINIEDSEFSGSWSSLFSGGQVTFFNVAFRAFSSANAISSLVRYNESMSLVKCEFPHFRSVAPFLDGSGDIVISGVCLKSCCNISVF